MDSISIFELERQLMHCFKTNPGEKDYDVFSSLVNRLYPDDAYRKQLGFDPIPDFLEGCYYIKNDKEILSRFSLYETPGLSYKGNKAIAIGSYECVDDQLVANYTLNNAAAIAKELGAEVLIGPMEGATWNNYRFTDNYDNNDPFFMEPCHKSYYPEQFKKSEFEKIAHYTSNIDRNLTYNEDQLLNLEKEFKSQGFTLRKLDIDRFEKELEKIAEFCDDAFKDNFLFTPIRKETFVKKYVSQKDKINPSLTLIAEDKNQNMVGIFFPIHDYLEPSGERFILKTMARSKEIGFKKMVMYLGQKTIKTAIEIGYKEVIHAFVHDNNVSRRISAEFRGHQYKTHSLFARFL